MNIRTFKDPRHNNPISAQFFCADPTAVEHDGRLYVYATNDHEQFLAKGGDSENTYEQIRSLLVFSTEDLVNWCYHGPLRVKEIAPWILNAWAPSVCARKEADGLTHFYLYFSNNGLGVGVLTATDPLGPWTDPLGRPLLSPETPGLTECPNPFDPGVVIDHHGTGWLAFGAGKAQSGSDFMPGSARIVQLGEDMLSFASPFARIPAPYNFEASELNMFGDTYAYTYNIDWSDHSRQWPYDCPPPTRCSMVCMTTKTPLDPESWEMRGAYFKNPGDCGFQDSNNHTHLHRFRGQYYLFSHTLMLKHSMGIHGGYRSLCVDKIEVNEAACAIRLTGASPEGVEAPGAVDPCARHCAALLHNGAGILWLLTWIRTT